MATNIMTVIDTFLLDYEGAKSIKRPDVYSIIYEYIFD
jgi:hypothetical protein